MFSRLRQSAERYREIEQLLQAPEIHSEPARLQSLLREMGALRDRAESYERWCQLTERRKKAEEMLGDPDAEVHLMAQEEVDEMTRLLAAMEAELQRELVDDDPNRGRNVFVEIRAGAGGDEASLFAAELGRIYHRFAEQQGLKEELLSSQPTGVGGVKELVLCMSGGRAWDLFRYESGGHRVQRVPETESQGRIHTSAATVAVLPEADEVEVQIQESDLRVDTYRAGGPGGQHVNKTSSAIRITHLPTDTVVQCQDESSQHKNKAKAMRMLRTRLAQLLEGSRKAEEAATRRQQIGSGDRSDRVRTYNFPQNRVTDHRTKTSYSLEIILLGHLEKVVEDLRRHDLNEKLEALGKGAS